MTRLRLRWPSSVLPSLLAALATWTTMWAWSGFTEKASGFLVPTLGGCLLVALSGMLLRTTRAPAVLVLLGQVVVLLLWLDHRWAADLSLGGWIPTPASLHQLGSTLDAAGAAAQQYASPVPKSVPAFYPLLIVTGVAAAAVVDFLACGLRKVPLAGLPLLALFTAPLSILDGGVGWPKFAVPALLFLFLLASDEARRLGQWGRQLSSGTGVFDSQATEVSSRAVWSSARKIGFTATGLAVIVPIFVPTLATGLFDGNGFGGGGDGGDVSISNPMVDLKRDLSRGADIDLLRVTTTEPDPSYLRVTVLDSFDGDAWTPSKRSIPVDHRADGLVPRPPGLSPDVSRTEVPYTIRVGSYFKSRWLPTPYPVYSIDATGDWRYDSTTLDFISAAEDQTTANLTYKLRALDVSPTAARLADAPAAPESVFTPYTALPKDLPESVRNLARQVTEGAPSRFEKAVRLQDWFRKDGGFTYSLERSSGNSLDQLVKFLGTGPGSRTGYCEQFAASMALMGRTLGIPSRVAVGFLRPDRVLPDTYVYSSHDLHAWPEMYFEGSGWVRFEPTPQTRATSVPAYTRGQLPTDDPSQAASSKARAPQQNRIDAPSASPGTSAGRGGRGGGAVEGVLVGGGVLLALLGLLGAPRLARSLVRRRRWARATTPVTLAEAAWRELRDTAVDLRLGWDERVTVRTRARALARSFGRRETDEDWPVRSNLLGPEADPEATRALERVVELLERARYSRTPEWTGVVSAGQETDVRDDVRRCARALEAGVGKLRRARATWLPASLLASLRDRTRLVERRTRAPIASAPGVDHAV